MAEKPTSSSTMYTTLGDPSGALGGSKGDQSGTESRMSVLITPLNGTPMIDSLAPTASPGAHDRSTGLCLRGLSVRPRLASSAGDDRRAAEHLCGQHAQRARAMTAGGLQPRESGRAV